MGLVEGQHRAGAPAQVGKFREGRRPAVHREDGVGDEQPPAFPAAMFVEQPRCRLRVALRIPDERRPGEHDRVVQTRVVGAVHDDGVAQAGERGDDREVRHVTGGKDEGRFGVLERRQVGLQRRVGLGVAGDEAAGARAPSPSVDAGACGLLDARVVRQAQVVVRGELKDRPPADLDVRPGSRPERNEAAVQPPRLQVIERLADEVGVGHAFGACYTSRSENVTRRCRGGLGGGFAGGLEAEVGRRRF